MRKTTLVLAAAIAFDLGVIVAGSHAAETAAGIYKCCKAGTDASSLAAGGGAGKVAMQDFHFTKIDAMNTPQSCMDHNGTVVKNSAGLQACQSKQVIPGAVEIHSWSWGVTQEGR